MLKITTKEKGNKTASECMWFHEGQKYTTNMTFVSKKCSVHTQIQQIEENLNKHWFWRAKRWIY